MLAKILVLIPAYNESERIGQVISRVREAAPDCDILVVNDGSRDGTAEAARSSAARSDARIMRSSIGWACQEQSREKPDDACSSLALADRLGGECQCWMPVAQ